MAVVESLLKTKASLVRPTPTQLEGASRSHNYARERLSSGQMESRIVRSYLSGSYERDTSVYPLDDVDIIFEIDLSKWNKGFFASRPEPKAVLQTFARALRRRYEAPARLQRRSVGLTLAHLHIDVVPAIAQGRDGFIMIPDRKAKQWIVSAPAIHSRLATAADKSCSGLFKPLVRLLKSWNARQPKASRLKSFGVETIALHLVQAQPIDTLTAGTVRFFDFVTWLGGLKPTLTWRDSLGIFVWWAHV